MTNLDPHNPIYNYENLLILRNDTLANQAQQYLQELQTFLPSWIPDTSFPTNRTIVINQTAGKSIYFLGVAESVAVCHNLFGPSTIDHIKSITNFLASTVSCLKYAPRLLKEIGFKLFVYLPCYIDLPPEYIKIGSTKVTIFNTPVPDGVCEWVYYFCDNADKAAGQSQVPQGWGQSTSQSQAPQGWGQSTSQSQAPQGWNQPLFPQGWGQTTGQSQVPQGWGQTQAPQGWGQSTSQSQLPQGWGQSTSQSQLPQGWGQSTSQSQFPQGWGQSTSQSQFPQGWGQSTSQSQFPQGWGQPLFQQGSGKPQQSNASLKGQGKSKQSHSIFGLGQK